MSMWGADSPTFPGRCGIYSPAIGAGQVGSGYHPVDVEGLHGIESPRTPYASSLTVAVRFHERPFGAEGADGRSRGRWCGGTVGGVRNEAKSGAWRLGRTGYGGSGGGVVPGGVLRGVLVYRGGGAGGVGGGMRNEPNFRVFRFGRISYGGVHAGLVLPAESPATFQFPKVVQEGWHGVDDVTMGEIGGVFAGGGFLSGVDAGFECVYARDGFAWLGARAGGELCTAAIGLNLYLGCHRASASPTVAGEQARFRGVGREVIEGKRRNRKMFE